eukprot:8750589-Prorocentrum_lima.AAC.1
MQQRLYMMMPSHHHLESRHGNPLRYEASVEMAPVPAGGQQSDPSKKQKPTKSHSHGGCSFNPM